MDRQETAKLFMSSAPINIHSETTKGLERRILNLPRSAYKQPKHDNIFDALCLGLLYADKKVVTIRRKKND